MKVKIVPPDNRVGVDGVFKTVALDFPHINAVDFNGEIAAIEHREYNGEWLSPETISEDEFYARFGDVLLAWESAPADRAARPASEPAAPVDAVTREEAQRMAAEAANEAVRKFAEDLAKATGG